jgi:uncharacterized protein YjbI with pentapeptide repeats
MKNVGSVLKFLQEAILMDKNKRIIDLSEANLSHADLSGAIVKPEQLDEAWSYILENSFEANVQVVTALEA